MSVPLFVVVVLAPKLFVLLMVGMSLVEYDDCRRGIPVLLAGEVRRLERLLSVKGLNFTSIERLLLLLANDDFVGVSIPEPLVADEEDSKSSVWLKVRIEFIGKLF